jgi:hypothetical protein
MRIAQPGGSACRLDRAAAPRDELRSHGRHHLRGAVRSRCRPGASRGRDQEGIAVPTDRHACYAVEHSPRERRSTGGWARLTGNTDSRQRPAGSDRLYWNGVLGWLLVRRSRGGYHRSTPSEPFACRVASTQSAQAGTQGSCLERLFMPEAVPKRAGTKNAQHYFLYSRSPIAVISTFSFQIQEIEKKLSTRYLGTGVFTRPRPVSAIPQHLL